MENAANSPWKKLSESIAFDSYRKILNRLFRLPNGKEINFEIFSGEAYVVIAAFTEDNRMLLAKQYRPGPEAFLYGLPSGVIDEGETPLEAAKRELLEETGYQAEEITLIKEVPFNYGDFSQYSFVATRCKKVTSQKLDSTEFIELELWEVEKLLSFIRNPQDRQLVNIDTAYLALDKLGFLT